MRRLALLIPAAAALSAGALGAGSYHLSDTKFYESYIVVHPAAYDGTTGGPIEVKVCLSPGAGWKLTTFSSPL